MFKFFLGSFLCLLLGANQSAKAELSGKILSEYKKTKDQVVEADEKQRQILGSIYTINKRLKKIVAEKSELDSEKMIVESSTRDLAERILQLTTETKKQKALLRERLVTIYKLGGPGVAKFILSSQNSASLDRNLKILGRVAEDDLNLIKDYGDSTRELSSKQAKFTTRLKTLKELEEKIKTQEQSLASENKQKEKILGQLRQGQAKKMAKLLRLREKSKKSLQDDDEEELAALVGPAFFEQKGNLPRPISKAAITQNFGLIKDEIHQVVLSHKGVFFAAQKGSAVSSVFAGKIAFAGDLPGFGQTVIVDHGDHYYSVYGDNEKLNVKAGDEVTQNQVIALSGISPHQFGPGLYFEIRHFSEPTDPRSWMKGSL